MTDLIIKAYDVLEEIKESDLYKKLMELDLYICNNLQEELKVFADVKNQYQEVLDHGGMYHPDFKEASARLAIEKEKLYQNKYVKSYLETSKYLDKYLSDFLLEIREIISLNIKTLNEFGFSFSKKGCLI